MLSKSHIFLFLLSELILDLFIFLNSFFHWLRNYTFNLYGLSFNLEHACLSEQSQNWIHNVTTFLNSSRTLEILTLITHSPLTSHFFQIFYFNFLYMNLILFIINFTLYIANMRSFTLCLPIVLPTIDFGNPLLPSGFNFLLSGINPLIIALVRIHGW